MPNVPFKSENVLKCVCMECPVETKSPCSSNKMGNASKMMRAGKMPGTRDVPRLYCSGGAAACKDLDFRQMCICGTCPVWQDYKLVSGTPGMYFCRDGKSR